MPINGVRITLASSLFGAAALSLSLLLAAPAVALDEKPTEERDLKACEQDLCAMILSKEATGDDLKCAISKTWAKDKIEKGASTKSGLSWGFGDARCTLDLVATRESIVSSVTKPDNKLEMNSHTVKCEIETGEKREVTTINVTLAPKVAFKDGKATKAELNITKVEAPAVIKAVITGADWIEKNVGLFHGEMIEEINEFVAKKCAKRYPELVKN
ncbi:MAG: hypothetical protein KJ587_14575 [Alphaproteobacteria bacterium]|nr:hypothetical protein [Alphaproteobacteria bacterium]